MIAAHLRHWFEVILNPFFLSILLLALSIGWLWVRGDGFMVRSGLVLSLVGFLLFSTGWLPATITSFFEKKYAIVTTVNPDIHWVVVLGGGHRAEGIGIPANDELSAASIARLVEGVRLYRQMDKAKLLLSGGAGTLGTTTEAFYLGTVASWFKIPVSDIVLETGSFNTADEAVAIKDIVHNEPFYLVTSAIHMPRAMALCLQQGLHPTAAPTSHSFYWETANWATIALPNYVNLAHTSTAWHEVLGLVWGKVRRLL